MGNQEQGGRRFYEAEGVNGSKISHPNTHALKAPPIIYDAGSVTGSRLRASNIRPTDLNEYIHTKTPKYQGSERYSRGQDYATEQDNENRIPDEEEEMKIAVQKRYQLKIDTPNGITTQIGVPHFDYDKKLTHFIKTPSKA